MASTLISKMVRSYTSSMPAATSSTASPYNLAPASPSMSCSTSSYFDSESDGDSPAHKLTKGNSASTASTLSPQHLSDASDCEQSDPPTPLACASMLSRSTTDDSVKACAPSSLASAAAATTYPIVLLLQLRAAIGACAADSEIRFSTQPRPASDEQRRSQKKATQVYLPHIDQKKVSKPPVKEAVVSSAGSWAAQMRLRRSKGAESGVDMTRQVRSVLNKLTPEKFDSLYEQLASLEFRTPYHVTVLVREIFEKATGQHNFISMYADLCACLNGDARILGAAATSKASQAESFRHILVNQCQVSFEAMLTASNEWGAEMDDSEEAEELRAKCKKSAIGNVKFIGKLLVLKMLSPKLLASLCNDLIDSMNICPDALECLAAMVTVTGPTFDTDANPLRADFLMVLSEIQDLLTNNKVSSRTKFLLRDVLELRAAGWVDGKEVSKQTKGPMKLQEVRSETKSPQASPTNRTPPSAPSSGTSNSQKASVALARLLDITSGTETSSVRTSNDESSSNDEATKAKKKKKKSKKQAATADSSSPAAAKYTRAGFRKELWAVLRDLAKDGDVARAVGRIEIQEVPVEHQASEFADLLTRVVEESPAAARVVFFDLCARLASGNVSAGSFAHDACLEGIESFFLEIFDELCEEVDELPTIVSTELLPTLCRACSVAELTAIVPPSLRSSLQ